MWMLDAGILWVMLRQRQPKFARITCWSLLVAFALRVERARRLGTSCLSPTRETGSGRAGFRAECCRSVPRPPRAQSCSSPSAEARVRACEMGENGVQDSMMSNQEGVQARLIAAGGQAGSGNGKRATAASLIARPGAVFVPPGPRQFDELPLLLCLPWCAERWGRRWGESPETFSNPRRKRAAWPSEPGIW